MLETIHQIKIAIVIVEIAKIPVATKNPLYSTCLAVSCTSKNSHAHKKINKSEITLKSEPITFNVKTALDWFSIFKSRNKNLNKQMKKKHGFQLLGKF